MRFVVHFRCAAIREASIEVDAPDEATALSAARAYDNLDLLDWMTSRVGPVDVVEVQPVRQLHLPGMAVSLGLEDG